MQGYQLVEVAAVDLKFANLHTRDGAGLTAGLGIDLNRVVFHGDRRGGRAGLQLRVKGVLFRDIQDDVLALERLKARRRNGDRIGSGREVGDNIVAGAIRLHNACSCIDAVLRNRH